MMQNQYNKGYNQKAKQNVSPLSVLLTVATYISFGLAYWYGARGTAAAISTSAVFANEIFAVILGGIIPFALLELALRFYIRPLEKTGITNLDKSILRLRLFFIAGNLVCFAASFIYFAYPFLSVWGDILLNFIVLLAALTLFFVFEAKRSTDKTKISYFVMQIGAIFLFMFGFLAVVKVVLGLL